MANHKSAKKRARQTLKKTEQNRYYRTRVKNISKELREAVESGNQELAVAKLKVVNQSFHSYVSKGFFKKETASRKVSRLAKLVNKLSATPVSA
jgi:small subunit ribosomal protein S20